MNILLINGSPKGERSNSLRLANAFVNGLKSGTNGETLIEKLDISKVNISACRGCFACWKATPGECCIKDDMPVVIEKLLWADMIIYSFPLYYFNIPGGLKNLIDRQLPMVMPFMSDRNDGIGSGSHESRYDMSRKKFVLVSTCGFYSAAGNYDSVCSMFDHICGKDNYQTIFCGQGELFGYKELSSRTDEYLGIVEKAGREYAGGGVSAETAKALQTLLFPKDVFEKMADASWGVSKESGEKEDESLVFTRQMAALYNKDSYDGKVRVLEICYTDLGKTYQILLNKDGSEVQEGTPLKYTTRIDTPWDVWLSIAQNEIRGDEALAKQMYRVSGDFSLMINWDKFFGSAGGENRLLRSRGGRLLRQLLFQLRTPGQSLIQLLSEGFHFLRCVSGRGSIQLGPEGSVFLSQLIELGVVLVVDIFQITNHVLTVEAVEGAAEILRCRHWCFLR